MLHMKIMLAFFVASYEKYTNARRELLWIVRVLKAEGLEYKPGLE